MESLELNVCRVCGLLQEFPWGETGQDPSHDICACCGVEFGYEDCLLIAIRSYRESWIQSGAKWWNEKFKPENWILEDQLKNIPPKYL
jgi:hypothetical protein